MRVSLRTKFSVLLLILILVVMGSIWWMSVRQQNQLEGAIVDQQQTSMRGELQKRARDIFTILEANAEAIAVGDYLTVDAVVRELKKSPDVVLINIVQKGRVTVPISAPSGGPPAVLPAWIEHTTGDLRIDLEDLPDGQKLLVVSGPIVDKSINVRVADAYVVISRRPIQDAIAAAQDRMKYFVRDARHSLTFATLIFSILAIVAAFMLITYVIRPLNVLAEGAKIIGEGNLDHEVRVDSNDEVGDLAKTFNVMTRNIREDRIQLIEKEKLDQELKIATQIQHNLLPKKLPQVSGYTFGAAYAAAREVSGDYYDFLSVPTNNGHSKIGVVVADVSGKGIPGAFMMTVTRSVLRAKAARGESSPADILRLTNSILLPDMKKGMFVSVFYGLLDAANAAVEFSSAGHNPTLVYRAASGVIESIRCGGMAMGIGDIDIFDRLIETRRLDLNPGDVFFQYTDGIQHAMNSNEERFGTPRLLQVLRESGELDAQEIVREILERVTAFTAGNPPYDDITMVAIKRV